MNLYLIDVLPVTVYDVTQPALVPDRFSPYFHHATTFGIAVTLKKALPHMRRGLTLVWQTKRDVRTKLTTLSVYNMDICDEVSTRLNRQH